MHSWNVEHKHKMQRAHVSWCSRTAHWQERVLQDATASISLKLSPTAC